MFKKLAIAAVLTTGLVASAAVMAEGTHGSRGHFGGGPVAELDRLDLSDSQWLQVRKIMQAHRQEARPLRRGERDLHRGFATLNPGSPDYAQQVAKLQDQAAQTARDRVKDIANLKSQVYAVLTDAQRAKLAERKAAFKQHRQKSRQTN